MKKQYIVVHCRAWMNESGFGFTYSSTMTRYVRRSEALEAGWAEADSDDFNIGTVVGDELVAFGWDLDDFAPEDTDLPQIAEQLYLKTPPPPALVASPASD